MEDRIPKIEEVEISSSKKIINPETGKEFGKFLKGKYLELIGSKKSVLFGGNTIVLSKEETTTVTGILEDVNKVARRGEVLEGVTKMGTNKGGINILRSSKWSELLEKYKYLESIDKNKYYKKVTDEFWEQANKPWLDEAIKRGDPVRLVTDPSSELGRFVNNKGKFILDNKGNKIPTIFSRKVEYLSQNGYKIEGHLGTKIK